MSESTTPRSDSAPEKKSKAPQDYQKALREELSELVDVVGPGALVDLLLERAFQLNSTDIHLDPTEQGLRVRLRVDGLLHDVVFLPPSVSSNVISRIKLMAGMDINQRRTAQDGRISNRVLELQRDIRVGSGPTLYGERLVLRLMPDAEVLQELSHLGFTESQLEEVETFLSAPYGMLLSAGPVGSGKSTTMYAAMDELNSSERSVVTIEDPVERRSKGVNQIQVEPKQDFKFVDALRGVLRQDPNVLMVGEIRDPETAHISCRAAMTGVIVLSTIHANDSASTIDVFREYDIPPMFIAESLLGIISQRLVRKVCDQCKVVEIPDEKTCRLLGIDPASADHYTLARGEGCEACFQTGHHGRTGVFEVMPLRGDIRDAIVNGKPRSELMRIAQDAGMMTLADAARQKVLEGITSLEEYHRTLSYYSVR